MNSMTYEGDNAKIEYDTELDIFRGEILGLTGGADFYGKNPKELRTEFKNSLNVFLEICRENGIEPGPRLSRQIQSANRATETDAQRCGWRPDGAPNH